MHVIIIDNNTVTVNSNLFNNLLNKTLGFKNNDVDGVSPQRAFLDKLGSYRHKNPEQAPDVYDELELLMVWYNLNIGMPANTTIPQNKPYDMLEEAQSHQLTT